MIETISEFGFQRAGDIKMKDNIPVFDLQTDYRRQGVHGARQGCVYLWVRKKAQEQTVVYVGKAGRTLEARCSQHVGGFKGGSKKGLKNADGIRAFLNASADHALHVYVRVSATAEVLGESGVSMCEVEEKAMIIKLRRAGAELWNAPS